MGYVIELLPSGACDLTKDRHIVGYDLDFEEALEKVRRAGEREVTVIELDGYQVRQRV
jgi:hypothetical protein